MVTRLMQDLHTAKSDLRSSEMQLNHAQLQVDALSISELQLRNERDVLQFNVAELEQDKLLLETKLTSIAGFEGGRGGSELGMENIRGKLLEVANRNIAELSNALRKESYDDMVAKKDGYITKLTAQIKSLRAELKEMAEQLARRTVLYSAQERRFQVRRIRRMPSLGRAYSSLRSSSSRWIGTDWRHTCAIGNWNKARPRYKISFQMQLRVISSWMWS